MAHIRPAGGEPREAGPLHRRRVPRTGDPGHRAPPHRRSRPIGSARRGSTARASSSARTWRHAAVDRLLLMRLRGSTAERAGLLAPRAGSTGSRGESSKSSPLAHDKGHPFPELDLQAAARGHAEQLAQVAANLVGNAIHYKPRGRDRHRADPRGRRGGGSQVSDTGEGIAPQICRMCRSFHRPTRPGSPCRRGHAAWDLPSRRRL